MKQFGIYLLLMLVFAAAVALTYRLVDARHESQQKVMALYEQDPYHNMSDKERARGIVYEPAGE